MIIIMTELMDKKIMENILSLMREKKEVSKHPIHESLLFGMLLAIVGGFLDAYTFVGRGGVFCNAQTGNIVFLGIYAAKGEWAQALAHVPPILAFMAGVVASEIIKKAASHLQSMDWTRAILIFELLVLFAIGFIPVSTPNFVITITVSFIASVQVSSFRKLVDAPFSTTMCTGNLRSASQAAYMAVTKKDRKAAIRSMRYFTIIFSFVCGACIGALITYWLSARAIWGAGIILGCAILLSYLDERKNQ